MGMSTTLDLTNDFNSNSGKVQIDTSGWETMTAQIQTPSGTVTFGGTNDAGAIQGVSDGNAYMATNWQAIALTNTATNTTATSTATNGIFKGVLLSRFVQFLSSGQTVSKLIVYLYKN